MIYRIVYPDYLFHHGVKGQKWGIRRNNKLNKSKLSSHTITNGKQLVNKLKERLSKTKVADGTKVTGITHHAVERMLNRKVKAKDVIDSLEKPVYISPKKVNSKGSSKQYLGEKSTTVVNEDRESVTTVWPSGKRRVNKYKKGGK